MSYYDGTKLLSLLDINRAKPEIYICSGNRTAGKTTYFNRLLINRYLKYGEKFILLYRFNYELDDCHSKFFKDIQSIFFPEYEMTAERSAGGLFRTLMLNDEPCGYAVSLNTADMIKKYSHMFNDVSSMLLDEFQSETNKYCPDEITKLLSIHTSVARGKGEQIRRVPLFLVGNCVSLINPYYVALGITNRLHSDTKFLRGDGFVMEQCFNESASLAQKQSAFNRAFQNENYVAYSAENIYLNDSLSFIETPEGKSRYVCTIKYNGANYAIREFTDLGIMYCDNRADMSFPIKIAVTTNDHNVNYIMLRQNQFYLAQFRYFFENGCFRFHDLKCKDAIISALSY